MSVVPMPQMQSFHTVPINPMPMKQQRLDASPHNAPTEAPSSPIMEGMRSPPGISSPFGSPIQCPKQKGAAMPCLARQSPPKKRGMNKIFDEAHHFGLCEHYAKLLEQAKAEGFQNVNWPTGFTLFHLAAKKNCHEFVQWLHDHDLGEIHAIDDFGKKPIDYACPHKRDSVHAMIAQMMDEIPPPLDARQEKYEAIKNGTYVPKKKIVEQISMDSIMESNGIAEGAAPGKRDANLITLYEAEQMIPADYKKALKQCSNGWDRMKEENKWPNGMSLLHWAARNGRDELCEFLMVEYGADPHEEDGDGHNAVYHAKLKKHRKLSKQLITKFRK